MDGDRAINGVIVAPISITIDAALVNAALRKLKEIRQVRVGVVMRDYDFAGENASAIDGNFTVADKG